MTPVSMDQIFIGVKFRTQLGPVTHSDVVLKSSKTMFSAHILFILFLYVCAICSALSSMKAVKNALEDPNQNELVVVKY